MPFVKPEKKREGIKILVYGLTGSGKTPFGLSFPNQAAIDSDSSSTFYDKENVITGTSVLSLKELNSDLDELELEEDDFEKIETFVVDSITRYHENQQHAALNVAEARARVNGRSAEAEGLSFKEYGKMKLKYDSFFQRMMNYSKRGKNLVFIAEQKDKTENINGTPVKVGVMPNMQKDSEYDFDVVIRTYNKEGNPYGVIIKDRTGTFKVGEEVEKPNYTHWKEAIEKAQNGKQRTKSEIKNYKEVLNDEAVDMDDSGETIKEDITSHVKEMDSEQKENFKEQMKKNLGDIKYKNFTDKKKLQQALDIAKSIK